MLTFYFSGPIVSALANKFGCRAVTIAGSIVACIAYIVSTFSPNVDVLILTYGALGGTYPLYRPPEH